MKTIKIPLKDYISNIREDKTIYLGLQSNMSIKGLDEEFLKKNIILREISNLKQAFIWVKL
ncbi:TPA: hypothetical protein RZK15_001657 [Campylobacter coli]|nr:hypothetical protein [Campylobacter coli]